MDLVVIMAILVIRNQTNVRDYRVSLVPRDCQGMQLPIQNACMLSDRPSEIFNSEM